MSTARFQPLLSPNLCVFRLSLIEFIRAKRLFLAAHISEINIGIMGAAVDHADMTDPADSMAVSVTLDT